LCIQPQSNPLDLKIVLIDFGFAIAIKPFTIRHHIGSYIYADMTYHYPRIHHQSYDMYSVGMTLLIWLNLGATEYNDVYKYSDQYTDKCEGYHSQVEKHKKNGKSSGKLPELIFPRYGIFLSIFNYFDLIESMLPHKYFALIGQMIHYNQFKRPIPSDLIEITSSEVNDAEFNPRDYLYMMPMVPDSNTLILIYEDDILCSQENVMPEIGYHCRYMCQHMNICYSKYHSYNIKKYLDHCGGASMIRWQELNEC
jgi:serine/threonine protein kinase